MTITARGLNRATLARQLLLKREPLPVADAVRRVVALQAQHPASPYLALWNRVAGFDPAELDVAFVDGTLVKATLMRITLHAVHADDCEAFRRAMQPTLRASRLGDRRFTATGLSPEAVDALVPDLLRFASQPRTNAEMEAWIDERVGVRPKPGVWWAVRSLAPLRHAATGGPWSFGLRPAYVAADSVPQVEADPARCLEGLVERYLEAFGPASAADVAQFALMPRARARQALASLAGRLEELDGPDGAVLFDVPGGLRPDGDALAPPRLMAMWDSVLLAYSDRARIIPPQYRKLVIRNNGDVLPTVLADGYVAGVWRPAEEGIEVTAFHPLSSPVWEELAEEARALTALVAEREPQVYRRYARWWTGMPGAEVRVLGGC